MALTYFAAEPLSSETVFTLGPLPVTNTMLFGSIMAVAVIILFLIAAKRTQLWPKSRFVYWFETYTETLRDMLLETFGGDKRRASKHFPLLITLFTFILICNLSGLLPGVQTISYNHTPIFRAWTTDLNSTLAMATLAILTVHIYALREVGARGYFRHFFSGNLKNPLWIMLGLLEVFSDLLRLVTLSLRLFGVIYGGEALLTAINILAGNFGWAASVPIMFLEIFFSLVQAYLFMMLTASYLVMAVSHGDEAEGHAAQPVPARG